MSEPSHPVVPATLHPAPRPNAMERAAQAAVEFEAGRHNPFASVDLSVLGPEVRAKVERWQREQGFTPAT